MGNFCERLRVVNEYELQDSYFFIFDSPFLIIAGVIVLILAAYAFFRMRKKKIDLL